MSKIPNLSPQALSNLITRDSKRSEWDVAIADALGVSVMWLVYGDGYQSVADAPNVTRLPAREPALQELIDIASNMSERGQWELIGQARLISAIHPKAKANPAS